MIWLLLAAAVAAVTLATWAALGRQRLRRVTRERLEEGGAADEPAERDEFDPPRPFARRHRLLTLSCGGLMFGVCYLLLGLPLFYCIAFASLAGLLAGQVDAVVLAYRHEQIEMQLADAIDLMVSAVKVGVSLTGALDSAAGGARRPLKPELDEVTARIRFGDDPTEVLQEFAERVPLETFRLFATSLIVNWQAGGNLAPTLAKVGRTIRDRIELSRRLRAITMQARASIVSILLVTYFIAALMWRNDPDRFVKFLSSYAGESLAAFAIVMQGLGVVWIAAISKPKF